MKLDMKKLARMSRYDSVRAMSEAMRAIDPEGYGAAEAVVKRRVATVKKYAPHAFVVKH